MRKLSAQMFSRFPRSTDRLAPAVVWERDDQMSGPGTGEMAVLVGGSVAVKSVETMRGVGARMRAGLRASNRRARHLPMRYETGLPSSVIRFRT